MPHKMSMEVNSASTATHAVNFHVLPSTGVWSSLGLDGEREESLLHLFLQPIIEERLKNKKHGQMYFSYLC